MCEERTITGQLEPQRKPSPKKAFVCHLSEVCLLGLTSRALLHWPNGRLITMSEQFTWNRNIKLLGGHYAGHREPSLRH